MSAATRRGVLPIAAGSWTHLNTVCAHFSNDGNLAPSTRVRTPVLDNYLVFYWGPEHVCLCSLQLPADIRY